MIVRVSAIEDWHWWQNSGLDWQWFLDKDRSANEKMRAGTALHSFLEQGSEGEYPQGRVGDYIFVFDCDCQIAIPKMREVRAYRKYGDLTVTGKTDALDGKRISDYKLIIDHQVEGEQYMDSYQWRYYLDLFGADIFDYVIFEAHEEPSNDECRYIRIHEVHKITQYRYPELHRDCANLAAEFLAAAEHSPELRQIAANGLEDARAKDHQVESIHRS